MALKNKQLENENALKAIAIEDSNKRFKIEERGNQEARRYLKVAEEKLRKRNLKLDKTIEESNEWKGLWEKSAMIERTTRSSLAEAKRESRMWVAELKNEMRSIKEDKEIIEGLLKEYQQALRGEQARSDELKNRIQYVEEAYYQLNDDSIYWQSCFMDLVHRVKNREITIELRNEVQYWKDKFSKLAWLANQAVIDVPKRLKKADAAMNPSNTPDKVFEFVEFCKTLITELLEKAKDAAATKKRERSGELKTICL